MKTNYYIEKTSKLIKGLDKYLVRLRKFMIPKYGETKTDTILNRTKTYYPSIIEKMLFFKSSMYDELIVTSSRMLAVKKGLKDEDIQVEEFVSLMIEYLRVSRSKVPQVFGHLAGKVFLSKLMRYVLNIVAINVTANGWPTEIINGKKTDNFHMKVCTRNCQMVEFMRSVGEEDLIPYCSFADFANAEFMGYSLKQETTIDSGVCTFCFRKKGKVYWPENIQNLINKN